jgi:hypothetical protein
VKCKDTKLLCIITTFCEGLSANPRPPLSSSSRTTVPPLFCTHGELMAASQNLVSSVVTHRATASTLYPPHQLPHLLPSTADRGSTSLESEVRSPPLQVGHLPSSICRASSTKNQSTVSPRTRARMVAVRYPLRRGGDEKPTGLATRAWMEAAHNNV